MRIIRKFKLKFFFITIANLYFLGTNPAIAHEDFYVIKDYGNIKTRIKTGYDFEEINKVDIIGRLAQKLSNELNYSNQIFLDFYHGYSDKTNTVYFLSFDDGSFQNLNPTILEHSPLKNEGLVIKVLSNQFEPIQVLKLVEYAILNSSSISTVQKQLDFKKWPIHWLIRCIDTTLMQDIVNASNYQVIRSVIENKIFRQNITIDILCINENSPNKKITGKTNYYWRNGKYYVFNTTNSKHENVVLELPNVYDLHQLSNSSILIFDTDSSFYFVNPNSKKVVSKRHIIRNTYGSFQPFQVKELKDGKIGIRFFYFNKYGDAQKTLNYDPEKDLLIQGR